MAYNSKYDFIDHIDDVFNKTPTQTEQVEQRGREGATRTMNMSRDRKDETHRETRSGSHSFSGILEEREIHDSIRASINSKATLFRFGGLLFRGKNTHDGNVVAHAVEGMTRDEARKLVSGWYFDLTTNHSDMFLTYDHSEPCDGHVVFSFRLPKGYYSLRELLSEPKSANCGEIIFRRLVALLAGYEAVTRAAGPYRPLCCISLDTVFINRAGNDVKLLPLVARHHDFPPYYPGEAGEATADVRTDLYTAALTALQFMSGVEMETENAEMADCSGIPGMDECLRVFQSRRPDIRTVLELLKQGGPGADRDFESVKFVGPDGEGEKKEHHGNLSLLELLRKCLPGRRTENATFSSILREED